jgi:predicted nucleic acid-binding protein
MIVADTNLVVAAVLESPFSKAAEAARARDKQWVGPRLLRSELLNVLTKYVVLAQTIDRDRAVRVFRRALTLVSLEEEEADPVDVVNTSIQAGLSSYDAEFVALARSRGVRLVTLDSAILKGCPDVAVSISDFAAGK